VASRTQRIRLRAAMCVGVLLSLAVPSARGDEPKLNAASVAKAKQCFSDAQAAYERGQLDRARDGFRCAYDIAPSPELAWNLGRVHERMGDATESVRFYELYLAASPKDAPERVDVEQRIVAQQALAERQRAQVRDTLPSNADLSKEARTFFQRGVKLYQQRRYAAALAAFSAALRASNAPELRYNLALTSERLGQLQDALDHYRAYLAAVPNANDHAAITAHVDALRAQLR
jgi:tetratricopeptide (TPR) repeat protein